MKAEQLKNSILQNAMEGKLMKETIPNNSTKFLLAKIKEKRDINLSHSSTQNDERLTPFKIPESWCWVKLSEIASITIGKTPAKSELDFWSSQDYRWVTIADMLNGEVIYNTNSKISQKAYDKIFRGKIIKKDTLIMSFKLTIGKTSIMGFDGFHNEAIASIIPFYDEKNTLRNYLLKILPLISQSGDFKGAIKGKTLNKNTLNNLFIPLPPMEDQRCIVEKIDELFKVVDDYKKLEKKLEDLNISFPVKMERSILQYAMQGKLVNSSNNGSVKTLLKEIREEYQSAMKNKVIRNEKISSIEKAEIAKEIPSNWEWVRLPHLCKIENGSIRRGPFGSAITKSMFVPKSEKTVKVYQQGNAIRKNTQYGDYYISQEHFEKLRSFEVKESDIIISCAGTIGETYVIPKGAPVGIINQALMRITLNEDIIDQRFFLYLFDYIKEEIKANAKGSAIKNLSSLKYLKNEVAFPLPPLEEQKEIVLKIDEAINYTNSLKNYLQN